MAAVKTPSLLVHPLLQGRTAFAVQAATCRPEVLDNVEDVERVDRLGEELLAVALKILVPVGDELHGLARSALEASLVGLSSRYGEGVSLRAVGRIHPAIDRTDQDRVALLVNALLEREHDEDGDHASVLRLVAFLPARLLSALLPLLAAPVAR